MNDIRRTILLMVFSFSSILLWDQWQLHSGKPATFFPQPKSSAQAPQAAGSTGAVGAAASAPVGAGVPQAVAAANSVAAGVPPTPTPVSAPHETIRIESDVLRLVFDTQGGNVVRAELLKHVESAGGKNRSAAPVVLFDNDPKTRAYEAQTGLVGLAGAPALPNHLSPMTVTGDRAFAAGQNQARLRFESAEQGGVKFIKTYEWARDSYVLGVTHEWVNSSGLPVSAQLYMQLVRDGNKTAGGDVPFSSTFTGAAVYTEDKKFQKVEFDQIKKKKADHALTGNSGYVAMVQHYFASAWIYGKDLPREIFTNEVSSNLYSVGMKTPMAVLASGASQKAQAQLFVGPQEEKLLEALTPGLELVKDYGLVTILAKPLYWVMDKLHDLLGNWGWSIVGLVVLLKIAFFGLNSAAYRSMAKMKAANPRVMEMRERLKDKPQQMQQEMMRIYKEEKVNPLGGCLPILIQFPFFIALYWVLFSSVEMRNAPWIGWIRDLSTPDPWFLLPALMAVTTVIQTALNPTPPDPLQAKLMWYMPLIFSVMFFFFPAGLVLYWLTNNILTILQQWLINKQMGVPVKISFPWSKAEGQKA